jgi:hypothetical protein
LAEIGRKAENPSELNMGGGSLCILMIWQMNVKTDREDEVINEAEICTGGTPKKDFKNV